MVGEKALNLINRTVKSIDKSYGTLLFYMAFSILSAKCFMETTMLPGMILNSPFVRVPWYFAIIVLFVLAVFRVLEYAVEDGRKCLLSLAVLTVGVLVFFSVHLKESLIVCVVAVAGTGRRFRVALLLSTIIGSVLMAGVYIASVNGYIPYLVYDRGGALTTSHAFGICYRTDFAAHVLYLVMSYAVLRGSKLHLWEYMMLWGDTWVVWRYSAARWDTACLVLFLTGLGVLHVYRALKGKWPEIPGWTALFHVFCLVLAYLLVAVFPVGTGIKDDTLSARVVMSRQAFEEKGVSLFGQIVEERGGGGIVDYSKPYYYLDISYVRILIIYGALTLIVYMALMMMSSYRAAVYGEAVLALALATAAVSGLMEQHAVSYSYNVLILAGTAIVGQIGVLPSTDERKQHVSSLLPAILLGCAMVYFCSLHPEIPDRIILLEERKPAYWQSLGSSETVLIEPEEDLGEGVAPHAMIKVSKEGFGDITVDDLQFYMRTVDSRFPDAQWTTLDFTDGSGIEFPENDIGKAVYGNINADGTVEMETEPDIFAALRKIKEEK